MRTIERECVCGGGGYLCVCVFACKRKKENEKGK